MTLHEDNSAIITKTKDLCAEIAADPLFIQLQASIERFLNDEIARTQYKDVHELGEQLHQKQHAGVELGAAEITAFEAARDALFENPTACEFMDAQRQLEGLQQQIGKYVAMTIELGSVPTADDLAESGGCCGGGGGGGGCGCHDGDDDSAHGHRHGHGHGGGGCACH
ncbi:MAG: YlbF family regulator [Verrucomicrobia bacterium]|nr:YlbF family regulator [Verrucomicrobiota bacterium]